MTTIFVLRVHLFELSKVVDLCDNFHVKYTQSLKKKMSHETMVGFSADSDDDMEPLTSSPKLNAHGSLNTGFSSTNETVAMLATTKGMVSIPLNVDISLPSCSKVPDDGGTDCSMASSSNLATASINEPLWLPNNGALRLLPSTAEGNQTCLHWFSAVPDSQVNHLMNLGNLPTRAVDVLRTWLLIHASRPFPDESDTVVLSEETGLPTSQIAAWFDHLRGGVSNDNVTASDQCGNKGKQQASKGSNEQPLRKRARYPAQSDLLQHSVKNIFAKRKLPN
ncbi:hypothetical protein AB6A40_004803 [Gnathostoma spinigerum]|uniref:Homeobox domain-containing protein n=1 Tax=Gnathostoma spinigerum TaxID=75299 RepID=A0ABD6ELA9_9BILA